METVTLEPSPLTPPLSIQCFVLTVFVRNLYHCCMYDPLAYLVVSYLLLYILLDSSFTNVDTRPWIETMRCNMKKNPLIMHGLYTLVD